MPELNKIPRRLEERSHLAVEFPQTDNRVFRAYIPFLENPKITERGKAQLNEYQLLGRPGSLFSYGGSPSRVISLTFKISLLNLLHLKSTEGINERFKRSFNLFFSEKEDSKKRFNLKPSVVAYEPADDFGNFGSLDQRRDQAVGDSDVKVNDRGYEHASIHRKYYRELVGRITGSQPAFDGYANDIIGAIDKIPALLGEYRESKQLQSPEQAEKDLNDTIDMVYVWLNLVRATTINNSQNTTLGPPTVRLTHGAMYNNVPCVVESYNINIIDESGFEMQSLTPKQLEINMTLKENRVGDFGDFASGKIRSGDNVVGWEAVISNNNIDPYNGLINPDKDYLV